MRGTTAGRVRNKRSVNSGGPVRGVSRPSSSPGLAATGRRIARPRCGDRAGPPLDDDEAMVREVVEDRRTTDASGDLRDDLDPPARVDLAERAARGGDFAAQTGGIVDAAALPGDEESGNPEHGQGQPH